MKHTPGFTLKMAMDELKRRIADYDGLKAQNKAMLEALVAAHDHLEYCNYGDSWESECARDEGLPEKIEAAIKAAKP